MPSPLQFNPSLQFPPRLLAEALRELLDSPSDAVPGLPAGTLTVSRAWLPVYQLTSTEEIVVTVLSDEDNGERLMRGARPGVVGETEIAFSIQQLVTADPLSFEGKQQIDAVHDFSERVLQAAFAPITAAGGTWHPLTYRRSRVDDTLTNWNQVTVLFVITYKAART